MAIDPYSEIVRKIENLERRMGRMDAAPLLSPGIGVNAFGAVAANNLLVGNGSGVTARQLVNADVPVGGLHPNRLSSWPAANYVLYDTGSGISVAQVQDVLCALNSINANKLIDATVTTAKIAARNITAIGFSEYSTAATWGAGAWVLPTGGNFVLAGLSIGASIILGVSVASLSSTTAGAILHSGVGIDSLTPSWYTYTDAGVAGGRYNIVIAYMYTATATAHTVYPLFLTNAGTLSLYGIAQHCAVAFHR